MSKICTIILVLVSIIAYSNSLQNGFIMDDKYIIESNPLVKSLANIPKLFASNYWANTPYEKDVLLYRPLTMSSFNIDYAIWGLNPFGYHLINILINAINSILVFLIIKYLITNPAIALISSLLFAIHPIHTEPINMLVGRTELLSTFFLLCAFLTYIKRYNLLITIALFLCALLSKETAIVLFVLFILFDTISELPKMTIAEIFKKYFKIWFLFFGLISIYIILRFLVLGGTFSQGGQAGIFQGKNFIILFATMIKAFGRYLSLLVIPVHLSPDYNDFLFSHSIFETNVMLSFVILTVTFISAIFLFKLNPTITYGIFWIFVALMPVSNIIPIGAILAERFLYLPSVGFSFFISGILSSISSKSIKIISTTLIGFVILIFGILTFNRNFVWQNEYTLWLETAKLYPDNVKAHYNLGTVWTNKGEFEKAIKEFEKCLIFNPDATWNPGKKAKANVYYNISLIYKSKGENEKYYLELIKAFELDPDNIDVKNALSTYHNEKGLEYSKKQNLAQALAKYKQAITLNPKLIEAYYNLGLTQYKLKDYENALNSFNECLKIEKNYANAYICIGNIFYVKGLYNNAIEQYKKALSIDPNSKEARTNYETLKNLGKFQ